MILKTLSTLFCLVLLISFQGYAQDLDVLEDFGVGSFINKQNDRPSLPNPHPDHNFISATAIPTPRGSFVWRNQMGIVNSLQVALSGHLSIGAGFEFLSYLTADDSGISFLPDGNPHLFQFNIKSGWKVADRLHLAGGYAVLFSNEAVRKTSASAIFWHVPYVAATYGSDNTNVTLRIDSKVEGDRTDAFFGFGIAAKANLSYETGLLIEINVEPETSKREEALSVGTFGLQFRGYKGTFFGGLTFKTLGSKMENIIPTIGFTRTL